MPAGAVRLSDKIQIICFGGRQRGFERRDARIRNGAGRQARVPVGVVSVVARQIGAIDRSAIALLQQRRINGGGIAIQRHPLAQPVFIHGRDDRPVLGPPGFLFDQRRERHDFIYRLGCARLLQLAPLLAELAVIIAQSCWTVVERVMR